jgi:hypothetical protein
MGDGKSDRKVLKRCFFHSEMSKSQIEAIFLKKYSNAKYLDSIGHYDAVKVIFKDYKKTRLFSNSFYYSSIKDLKKYGTFV